MTWLLAEVCLNGRAPAYRLLADDCCWTRHRRPDVVDDETESLMNQNDVRRPILCRRRTTSLEESTGVNSQPSIINYV